jgi:hypothetical protein
MPQIHRSIRNKPKLKTEVPSSYSVRLKYCTITTAVYTSRAKCYKTFYGRNL